MALRKFLAEFPTSFVHLKGILLEPYLFFFSLQEGVGKRIYREANHSGAREGDSRTAAAPPQKVSNT